MERLAEFEHNEVRYVDHVVDRANADGFKFGPQPPGAGTDLDIVEQARRVIRAGLAGVRGDQHRQVRRRVAAHGRFHGIDGVTEGLTGERRHLSRQPDVAEQVGAVRSNFEVEDRVVREQAADGCADRGAFGQD